MNRQPTSMTSSPTSSSATGTKADILAEVAEYLATPLEQLLYLYPTAPQLWHVKIPPDAEISFYWESEPGFATCSPPCQEHWRQAKVIAQARNVAEGRI